MICERFRNCEDKGRYETSGPSELTRALHKSGRRLYVEMTFAIVKGNAEGEVIGSVAMARDVRSALNESALHDAH